MATLSLSQIKRSTGISRDIDTLEIVIEVEDNLQHIPDSLRDLLYGEEYGAQPDTIMACASDGKLTRTLVFCEGIDVVLQLQMIWQRCPWVK